MTDVCLYGRWNKLDREILEDHFNLIEDPEKAEYAICWSEVPEHVSYDKCILFMGEPPVRGNIKILYSQFEKFHTVFTFTPKRENEFHITYDPIAWPYKPRVNSDIKTVELEDKKIYYCGQKAPNFNLEYSFNGTIIKSLRDQIATYLDSNHNVVLIGRGWGENTKEPGTDWRDQKLEDIEDNKAEIQLCMENCILENYISEKIHDGFRSKRLVMYLGEPYISEHVPPDCFINLNPLFDGEFDYQGLSEIIEDITPEQYRKTVEKASKWHKSLEGRWERDRDLMTEMVVRRINE